MKINKLLLFGMVFLILINIVYANEWLYADVKFTEGYSSDDILGTLVYPNWILSSNYYMYVANPGAGNNGSLIRTTGNNAFNSSMTNTIENDFELSACNELIASSSCLPYDLIFPTDTYWILHHDAVASYTGIFGVYFTFTETSNYHLDELDSSSVTALEYNSNKWYVLDDTNDQIAEFDSSFNNLANYSLSALAGSDWADIHYALNKWWVLSSDQKRIYRLNSSFGYDDLSFSVNDVTLPVNMEYIDTYYFGLDSTPVSVNYFFVTDKTTGDLYLYNYSNYTAVTFPSYIPSLSEFNFRNTKNHYSNSSFTLSVSQDTSLGNCTIVNNQVWFYADLSLKGEGYCLINHQGEVENQDVRMNVSTYDLDDLGITVISSPGSGGGSSSSTTYVYNYIQQDEIPELSKVTTEMFLGNKIVLIAEAKGIEIQTENFADRFDLSVSPGDIITKRFRIKNIGEEEIILDITCDGDFCDNVELDKTQVNLGLGIEELITMAINVPQNLDEDEIINYNIVVQNVDDETFKTSLPVKLTVNKFLGFLTGIFSIEKMFLEGLHFTENFYIPNFLLMMLITATTFILLSIAYSFSARNPIFNAMRYIFTILSIIIFLVLI